MLFIYIVIVNGGQMALVVPNVGEASLLQKMLNQNQTANLVLGLYINDLTPNAFTTFSGIVPCTTTGYVAATIPNSAWVVGTPVGANYSEAGYPEQPFTFSATSAPTLVYGYYVTDTNDNLLWLERFTNAPFTVPPAGGNIGIILTINLENV
jgi:hypothetical protein